MTYAYLGSISESEPPANSDVSNTSNWALRNDEVYSRDVSGKEMAIYQDNSLLEYPTYGLDMIGKIKDDELHFYLKDHLGSIRATIYDNKLMSAQGYDEWGYLLENRVYESDESIYKFTSKERDEENQYDYFGARYYDARVGRRGQMEPLFEKYIKVSPYSYGSDNPIYLLDIDGMDLFVGGDKTAALNDLKSLFSDVEIQYRISADDNGSVSFDVNGLDLTSDAALELLNSLVTSENKFLFEVSNTTIEVNRKNGEVINYDLSDQGYKTFQKRQEALIILIFYQEMVLMVR